MRKYEENALYWKVIGMDKKKKGKTIGPQVGVGFCWVLKKITLNKIIELSSSSSQI